jgi:glycosyltransferase involved in cell wall biosynthesis
MDRLRVLITMLEPPLPFGNAAARWFHVLLKGLVERGHRVSAFATASRPREVEEARALFPAPRYDLRVFAHPERRGVRAKLESLKQPYSYMFAPELRRELAAEKARGYDILHLEQLWCGWLGLDRPERALVSVHHLTRVDLGGAPAASIRDRVERRLMLGTEDRLVRTFRHFRACSPRLETELRRLNPAARVATVPVGLDLGLYGYIPDAERSAEPVVTLIGTMRWFPNNTAAERLLRRLWPAIRARVPGARLEIVGWSARQTLREFLEVPGVSIEENVDDIRPYWRRAGVLVYAPARGSGMKVKVLEAMAFGVPVVTTEEGVEGLPARDGVHAGVADDDAGLVERAVRLLGDPEARNRQRAAARALVEEHCGPKATLDALERVYEGMVRA